MTELLTRHTGTQEPLCFRLDQALRASALECTRGSTIRQTVATASAPHLAHHSSHSTHGGRIRRGQALTRCSPARPQLRPTKQSPKPTHTRTAPLHRGKTSVKARRTLFEHSIRARASDSHSTPHTCMREPRTTCHASRVLPVGAACSESPHGLGAQPQTLAVASKLDERRAEPSGAVSRLQMLSW